MKWLDDLLGKAIQLSERSFFWKQFFAWAPPLALVFGIDWFVTGYFNAQNPETADGKRRTVMILLGIIALCLSILLRAWAKKEEKSHRDDDGDD